MIYPVRPAAAWKAVQTLMSELDVNPQTRIRRDRQQFYVGRTDYANRGFPSATELGLPTDLIPGYVQLHISVAAGFEPARVAVGSLISAAPKPELTAPGATPTARARRVHVFYGVAPMAKWIHGRLAALLGVAPEPLSAHGQAERAAQSDRLLPGAVPLACRETPPLPEDRPRALEDLEIIYRHPLEYSRDMVEAAQQAAGKGTVFSFSGEVTEHGTLAYLQPAAVFTSGQRIVQTPLLAEALRVAQQAAHLSRWEPVVIGGCPVSVPVRINVRFDR
jgi:hypothetical protein